MLRKTNSMKFYTLLFLFISSFFLQAQNAELIGVLNDEEGTFIEFANVVLYNATDSSMVKVETSDDKGIFKFVVPGGSYYLNSSYVGYTDINKRDLNVKEGEKVDLGILTFSITATALEEATVTARRAMVEVKPDRTVFNVQGTINAIGSDGISLLRKAPGVVIDNNNNINILGRSGVLVYVDGKRLPLGGDDLSNYLQSLTADQIDRIDIITNPGSKYEAEGNAGIIDIRLKKDKSHGGNGSISSSISKGRYFSENINFNGNYRDKKFNVFGSIGLNNNKRFSDINFQSNQNGIELQETANFINSNKGYNTRVGFDYFISKDQTIGILLNKNFNKGIGDNSDVIKIGNSLTPEIVDSTLIANTTGDNDFDYKSVNLNYRYDPSSDFNINIDLDYGLFDIQSITNQPNEFYDEEGKLLLSNTDMFNTPREIEIITTKLDIEKALLGGLFGIGTKVSLINSDNSFLVSEVVGGVSSQDNQKSNLFSYDEKVFASYFSFSRKLNDFWNLSAGLRSELTYTTGDLTAFLIELEKEPVEQSYLSLFPNLGFTYSKNPNHVYGISFGRRINRPDYKVLNPFNNQLSEISFEKGNPNLSPEIVNNVELSYTWQYRYNFKLSYSRTMDQITRLIGPDESDPRATFINWDNLAEQTIYNASVSLPIQVSEKWNAYFNGSVSFKDNQADYGDGAVVDLQAWSYNIYQQQTFNLPKEYIFEFSGWFSGPGIWGGVFRYDPSYSLNLGVQKRFFNNQLNVKLSADDILRQAFWSGESSFDGLYSKGNGMWDSRRVTLNLNYNFGNQNVKSRKRKTGLEDEVKRANSEG